MPIAAAADRLAIFALPFACRWLRAARGPALGPAGYPDQCACDRRGRSSHWRRLAGVCVIPTWPQKLNRIALRARAFCSPAAFAAPCRGMVSLTDPQLKIVMTAANAVPVERRSVFLERVGAMLKMRRRFSDADVSDVTQLALAGLVQRADVA
jgi:hypothetical protein